MDDRARVPKTETNARRPKTSSEEVYQQLRGMILENLLLPGERVNIDALARELEVSQTPVREALRRLEGDRLLHQVPGKGYRTTPLLDLDELRQLFEFRLVVDLWAARETAVNRLSNPGPSLLREVTHFNQANTGASDIRQLLVAHDTAFHDLVHQALGNDVVRSAYAQTHSHLHTFRLYSPDTHGELTIEEHIRIAQAIAECDPAEAEAAMRDHLTQAFDRFASVFDENPTSQLTPATPRHIIVP